MHRAKGILSDHNMFFLDTKVSQRQAYKSFFQTFNWLRSCVGELNAYIIMYIVFAHKQISREM